MQRALRRSKRSKKQKTTLGDGAHTHPDGSHSHAGLDSGSGRGNGETQVINIVTHGDDGDDDVRPVINVKQTLPDQSPTKKRSRSTSKKQPSKKPKQQPKPEIDELKKLKQDYMELTRLLDMRMIPEECRLLNPRMPICAS